MVKNLVWDIVVTNSGTKGTCQSKERSGQRELRLKGTNEIPEIFWSKTQFELKNQNKNFELDTS